MNKQDLETLQKKRAAKQRLMKDRAMVWVSMLALPSICLMVGALIYSAKTLGESQLAVISGLVSSVTIGLITVLQRITGAEKEDPLVSIAKELVTHITDANEGSKEIIMDDKSIRIQGKDSKIVQGKNLIYGNDKNEQ
tara:strand:+ start:631 stop:1044 length:414 start_codon:yes stop_codon:yes gene_type:complete